MSEQRICRCRWIFPEGRKRVLRIALVTETYPPEVNGVAMTLQRLAEGLVRRGRDLQVIRPRQGRDDHPRNSDSLKEILVPGLALPFYPELKFGLPCRIRLTRLWRRQRPDLVHVATEGPLGLSALNSAQDLKIPLSSSFHTNFQTYSEHYGMGFLRKGAMAYLRYFHNRTLATFAPTAQICTELERNGLRNLRIFRRGVDTQLFSKARRDPTLRAAWKAERETPVVAYVGRLAAEKNLPLVVRAFLTMREINKSCRFVLVGDGPLRASLEGEHRDFIFCGLERGEELARHYASADIFVFPSLTETFGNVVTEAMASGLAVVAYDCAAAGQHIRQGVNGLVAPPGREDIFLQMAKRVVEEPRKWQKLGSEARRTALGITWSSVVDEFDENLEKLAASAGDVEVERLL